MSYSQTELAYPLEDDQAPHIEKLRAKFNAHFLRDQQGGLDIWINIVSHELLPPLQNQFASEYPAHGPRRAICRAWRQNLYLRRVMTSSDVKAVEAAVDVFHEVRELLRKQVEHNLYRIRESATSELVQRTLCDILAINLGNRIGVGEQLEDFRLEHSGGVSLNVGCSDPVHLPLIQLVMDARFQFDMPVTEGSCPPGWFPSVQSSDKAQCKKAPSFYFVEPNVSSAITEEIRNDERSCPHPSHRPADTRWRHCVVPSVPACDCCGRVSPAAGCRGSRPAYPLRRPSRLAARRSIPPCSLRALY